MDESMAGLALLMRMNPRDWTLLDEILVDDKESEDRAVESLALWAITISSGEGVWAPLGAYQAMVTGTRLPRTIRLLGRYVSDG